MTIAVKRAYDEPKSGDGYRILVDRIWPRGVSKENAKIDEWIKEIAPSSVLRRWFAHDPKKWDEFKKRYFHELDGRKELTETIRKRAKRGRVTLVYSAKDEKHSNAAALKEYLEKAG